MSRPDAAAGPGRSTAWAPDLLGDLSGRSAVVTGASSGLGLETSAALARAGARVVLTVRSEEKGERARARVRDAAPAADVRVVLCDLADLASVRAAAAEVTDRLGGNGLDLLVNNAGVMAVPRQETADGFELQLGTNFLGHFALTGLLLPGLLASEAAGRRPRVVTLSSIAHRWGRLRREDLMRRRRYTRWGAYGQSKLADLLFALELDRRTHAAGRDLRSVAAHPGLSATALYTSGPLQRLPAPARRGAQLVLQALFQSAELGSWPVLRAAGATDVVGGEYYGPGGTGELGGLPVRVGASTRALDPGAAAWLWRRAVHLTGVDFGALGSP